MKNRGRKLKTSLFCLFSLLLALSSFAFALAETQTQTYSVPFTAELVPEGYLDFTITAGTITAKNRRENPNMLTYSSIEITNNESTDAIEVSSIAYTAPTAASGTEESGFALASDSADFTAMGENKFSMVVACGTDEWDLGAAEGNVIRPATTIAASNNTVTFRFSGKVTGVDEDMSHVDLGKLTVTVSSGAETTTALYETVSESSAAV